MLAREAEGHSTNSKDDWITFCSPNPNWRGRELMFYLF